MKPNNVYQSNPLLKRDTPVLSFQPAPQPRAPEPAAPVSTPSTTTGVADVPAPRPSDGNQLADIKAEALRIQDIIGSGNFDQGGSNFATASFEEGPAYDPFDEDKARRDSIRNQTRLYQAEIDATNEVYDQLLNEARLEGTGRLGSQRASAARGGLLGSDFAASQKNKVQNFNTDINRGIQAERTAAIGAIMGNVRSSVEEEMRSKREARQLGAEEYMNWLTNRDTRRDNYKNQLVSDMIAQGIDIKDMTDEELAEYVKPAGLSANAVRAAFVQAQVAAQPTLEDRKTEAEIRKIDADIAEGKIKSIGEGTMLYNTETGETFKNPKTYKPGSASGLSIGGQSLTQEQIADVHALLNETRGSDGYANTGTYMEQFNGFVALGGDPKDFVKEYDPNIYINPNDPTRSFLQTEMKKTPAQAVEEELTALEQLEQLQQLRDSQ